MTGSSSNPYQYTGRENDGTGLYYYRARYYNPRSGTFLSEDRVKLSRNMNLYAYAENDPIILTDPYGLTTTCRVVSSTKLFSYTYTGANKPLSDWYFTGVAGTEGPEYPIGTEVLICNWERKIAKETWRNTISWVKYNCTDGCRTWSKHAIESHREWVSTTVVTEDTHTTIPVLATDSEALDALWCIQKGQPVSPY
jgi:RHS repeat-associated protein